MGATTIVLGTEAFENVTEYEVRCVIALSRACRMAEIVVLSRRPGRVREIFHVERPLTGRSADDPDLLALERTLWRIIRDDAAVAERERIDAVV